jgi:N-acetylglucosaminyl-diphospho-decaprenol L-rhamnosyltransferase
VLLPALASAFASTLTRELETLVVDNASTDGARDAIAARFPQVRIETRRTRQSLSQNLNHGAAATSFPYVMLCNSDLLFAPDAIERLACLLDEHPQAAVAAPRLVGPDGGFRASARRWYTMRALCALKGPWRERARRLPAVRASVYDDWDMASTRSVDWVPCPAILVRRSAFTRVGGMDERFPLYFTDVDLSLRLHEAGFDILCEPSARVVHLERRASAAVLSRAWRAHLAALLRFVWKHRGLRPRRAPG